MPCNGTHKVNPAFLIIVLHHIPFEECGETIGYNPSDTFIIYMPEQERREGCQETTGEGLPVDTLDNNRRCEVVLLQQLLSESQGELILQCIAHQLSAPSGTAAFITQDKAEG